VDKAEMEILLNRNHLSCTQGAQNTFLSRCLFLAFHYFI